ncbi:DUF5819 family protein [Microbacterium sp. NPDC076911]|uniref:DUF5819 family protein n=1 Tax=Microbacterium sp. NPDC076911 TaxID=3154958 RepID=UPI0034198968
MSEPHSESIERSIDSKAPRPRRISAKAVRHTAFVAVAILGVWHIGATFLYSTPSTPLREAIPEAVLTNYNYPLFSQNWSVFAPEPIAGDYGFSVRAALEGADGELVNTEWVNVAAAEADLLRHNPLSPRAGYAAYSQSLATKSAYDALTDAEREVIADSYYLGDDWAYVLEDDLFGVAESSSTVLNAYLREEWRATAYATQVAKAMWGDGVATVQYYVSTNYSVPFEERNAADATGVILAMDSGWRGLIERPGQGADRFADVFLNLELDSTEVQGTE